MPAEIERKFLIDGDIPNMDVHAVMAILQCYVALDPSGTEVRVRNQDDLMCTLTIKSGAGMVRAEVEAEITSQEFDELALLDLGRRITKVRSMYIWNDITFEVDVYSGTLDGLRIVEAEFDSLEAADAFVPPSWFGLEVTDDARYKNKSLAVYGRP